MIDVDGWRSMVLDRCRERPALLPRVAVEALRARDDATRLRLPDNERALCEVFALAHDIGKVDSLRTTGTDVHPLDGAAFALARGAPRLAALIAHLSGARYEAWCYGSCHEPQSGVVTGVPRTTREGTSGVATSIGHTYRRGKGAIPRAEVRISPMQAALRPAHRKMGLFVRGSTPHSLESLPSPTPCRSQPWPSTTALIAWKSPSKKSNHLRRTSLISSRVNGRGERSRRLAV